VDTHNRRVLILDFGPMVGRRTSVRRSRVYSAHHAY
jgi:hypothetical protein